MRDFRERKPLGKNFRTYQHFTTSSNNPKNALAKTRKPSKDQAPVLPAVDFVKKIEELTSTFFFTNFPEEWKSKDLKEVFEKFGSVIEVVIPNKRDKRGKRFGFVRFKKVKDERKLERDLGDIWIGTYKVRINIPKFRRGVQKKAMRGDEAKYTVEENKQSLMDGRSFVEVARKKNPVKKINYQQETILEYRTEDAEEKWLAKCLVGYFHEGKDKEEAERELRKGGYPDLKLINMGGKMVLMQFESWESLSNLKKEESEWLDSWFQFIRPWQTKDVVNEREIWIGVTGIPLHGWNLKFFRLVASTVGRFLEVDTHTKNKEHLDKGRIRVATSQQEHILKILKVKINDETFEIRMEEESNCSGLCDERIINSTGYTSSMFDESSVNSEFSEFIPGTELEEIAGDDVEKDWNQLKILTELENTFGGENKVGTQNTRRSEDDEESFFERCESRNLKDSGKHQLQPSAQGVGINEELLLGPGGELRKPNFGPDFLEGKEAQSEGRSNLKFDKEVSDQFVMESPLFKKDTKDSWSMEMELMLNDPMVIEAHIEKDEMREKLGEDPVLSTKGSSNSDPFQLEPLLNRGRKKPEGKKERNEAKETQEKESKQRKKSKNKQKILSEDEVNERREEGKDEQNKADGKSRKRGRPRKKKDMEAEASSPQHLKNSLSDSDIVNCNRKFCKEFFREEANQIWELGKCLGLEASGNTHQIIEKIEEIERRDLEAYKK